MQPDETYFQKQVYDLIDSYGNLDFFQKAIEKQKVTRHIINSAKSKLGRESFFWSLISLAVVCGGLSGYLDAQPAELTFLIPFGIVMFFAVRSHTRKVKKALNALSQLAKGVHRRKLGV